MWRTFLLIVFLTLCVGAMASFFLHRRLAKSAPSTQTTNQLAGSPQPQPTPSPPEFTDSTPVVSPDKKSSVFVRDHQDTIKREMILRSNDHQEKVVDTVDGVLIIVDNNIWSPDSNRLAYSIGSASSGHTLVIKDLETSKTIDVDGNSAFLHAVKESNKYSHIYSHLLDWRNNDEMIITVSGIHDFDKTKSLTLYFLVNAKTGKVVKKLL